MNIIIKPEGASISAMYKLAYNLFTKSSCVVHTFNPTRIRSLTRVSIPALLDPADLMAKLGLFAKDTKLTSKLQRNQISIFVPYSSVQ